MDPKLTRRIIAGITANVFETNLEALAGRSRAPRHCKARYAIWFLVKEIMPVTSLSALGDMVGGKDHSTVLHGLVRAKEFLATDPNFQTRIEKARKAIAQWRPEACVRPEPIVSLVPVAPNPETLPAVIPVTPVTARRANEHSGFEYEHWRKQSCLNSEALLLARMMEVHPERVRVHHRHASLEGRQRQDDRGTGPLRRVRLERLEQQG